MQELMGDPVYVWLVFGAALILFEAFTAPGLGLFLVGLGALCTGIVIESGLLADSATALQFVSFFSFTIAWAVLLWKPLVKFRAKGKGKNAREFNNMVGDSAVVAGNGLKRGETGQVLWSGTVMNAEIDDSVQVDALLAGAQVEIKSVSGNKLKVIPK